jgi:hypothetical protein
MDAFPVRSLLEDTCCYEEWHGDGFGYGRKLTEYHDEFVLYSNIDFQHQGTW